jgi:YD repeat-containing protein
VVEKRYDARNHETRVTARTQAGDGISQTQHSYDGLGRLACSTVRMNVYAFASPPASACQLGPEMGHGPGRITHNAYDAAGQLIQMRVGVGTADEAVEVANAYNLNGQLRATLPAPWRRAVAAGDEYGSAKGAPSLGHGCGCEWTTAGRPHTFRAPSFRTQQIEVADS